jgi:hypothetical protein
VTELIAQLEVTFLKETSPYPAEAIFSFAGTFPLFLFSNSAPMWEFFFFPRFMIPLIPFLLFVFSDCLPRDRRILWGVAL